MAKETPVAVEPVSSRTGKPRAMRMVMPDTIPEKFGVQFHDDAQAQGVAKGEDLSELGKVFGIPDLSNVSFPHQFHGRNDGKDYEFRLEPSGSHNVNSTPIVGHPWIFRQTRPELTAQ